MTVIEVTCPQHQPIRANDNGIEVIACVCGRSFGPHDDYEARHLFIEHAGGAEYLGRRFLAFDILQTLYGRAIRII